MDEYIGGIYQHMDDIECQLQRIPLQILAEHVDERLKIEKVERDFDNYVDEKAKELKSCPFCDSSAEFDVDQVKINYRAVDGIYSRVRCTGESCCSLYLGKGGVQKIEDKVIDWWLDLKERDLSLMFSNAEDRVAKKQEQDLKNFKEWQESCDKLKPDFEEYFKNLGANLEVDERFNTKHHTYLREDEKTENLTFGEALEALRDNKHVTRLDWSDSFLEGYYNDNKKLIAIRIKVKVGGSCYYMPDQLDILANDWKILKEE